MNVLIVYGTTYGHTRHVCQFVQDALAHTAANITVCDLEHIRPDPAPYDVCFIGASVHVGNYQAAVVDWVRNHHDVLNRKRAAFLSVSLSAAGENPRDWEGLEQCVRRFMQVTSWSPVSVHHVGGAIRYSRYDFFKRLALKFVAHKRGQETVSSRDYDLTDYDKLRHFAIGFVEYEKVPALGRMSSGISPANFSRAQPDGSRTITA